MALRDKDGKISRGNRARRHDNREDPCTSCKGEGYRHSGCGITYALYIKCFFCGGTGQGLKQRKVESVIKRTKKIVKDASDSTLG